MSTAAASRPPNARAVVLLRSATVAVGLMAGLFFAWDVSVMPGLGRLDDRTYLSVLAELIVSIENPAFYLVLVAALGLTAAAAVAHGGRSRWWIVAALLLYVVALVVTGAVHMPLNQSVLDAVAAGRTADLAAVRATVELPWRVANVVRTVVCALAMACLVWVASRRR